MKSASQVFRAKMRHLCGLGRIGPNYGSGTFARTPVAGNWHSAVAALIILIFLANSASAQFDGLFDDIAEYCSTETPIAIRDYDTSAYGLTISDPGLIADLNVSLTITHSYDANLDVFLIGPDGTRVELFTDVGGFSANFDNTILDDEAAQRITSGWAPFSGTYRPEGSLADFIGIEASGLWTLEITDDWPDFAGTLESWCLIATLQPKEPLAAPVIESNSDVPGGMHNGVSWDDVGPAIEYESTVSYDIPLQGTMTQTLVIEDRA